MLIHALRNKYMHMLLKGIAENDFNRISASAFFVNTLKDLSLNMVKEFRNFRRTLKRNKKKLKLMCLSSMKFLKSLMKFV